MDTILAKRVVKPILETANASDVIVYVWLIFSCWFWDKVILKTCNVKKNKRKCTKFTIKN